MEEVRNTVQEAEIKTIPKKKKCKKAKWLSKELRKEVKLKSKEKRKDSLFECKVLKTSKER